MVCCSCSGAMEGSSSVVVLSSVSLGGVMFSSKDMLLVLACVVVDLLLGEVGGVIVSEFGDIKDLVFSLKIS